jgi:2',3'-cyclic-nucleotide 2'-phosphodiesterase/3'-nucleotidase
VHSYLALCASDPSLALIAAAQVHAAAPYLPKGLPVLSAAAPAKSGGRAGPDGFTDIAAGPVLRRHPADLLPFANTLRAVRVTGAAVADWLERSACIFARIEPGLQDQPLREPDAAGHDFDVLHGLTYRIDPTRPARFDAAGAQVADTRRVVDIRLGGTPLDADREVVVLTNNYRANGGGGFAAASDARAVPLLHLPLAEAVIALLRNGAPPPPAPVWRFAHLPGTTAIIETAPKAQSLLPPGMTARGIGANGFLRVSVDLGRD